MSDFLQKQGLQELAEISKRLEILSQSRLCDLSPDEVQAAWPCFAAIKCTVTQALDTLLPVLISASAAQKSKSAEEPDRLLTLEEAAQVLRVDPDWIYKHKKLPFRVKLAGKTLRFSANGIKRWLAGKGKTS